MSRRHVLSELRILRSISFSSLNNHHTIDFNSISTAYGYKSKRELLRGWTVFKLCSYPSIVNRLSKLFTISRTIFGQRLFEYVMRSSLYGHFVAGTNQTELKPIVEKLQKHGVNIILDYCMESDVVVSANHQSKQNMEMSTSQHAIFDENMFKAIENIKIAAELCGSAAFVVIKITAFVRPTILQKLNQLLEQESRTEHLSTILELVTETSVMNADELIEIQNLLQRINRIVQTVEQYHGRLFIDAEQSYFQSAIHRLVLELQQLYNRERLLVYNTYQCYRKSTLDLLRADLARAKSEGFHIGFKLVRGAYMDQERKLAADTNSPDPIHPNFEATTECYYRAFFETLENAKTSAWNNKIHVFVASHNEDTVRYALKTMDSMNVKYNDGLVSFATLFGMCDYLTFPLAAVGFDAYKLTPYGPLHRLLPYLTRRAQENRAIFAKAEKDRLLHYKALRARF